MGFMAPCLWVVWAPVGVTNTGSSSTYAFRVLQLFRRGFLAQSPVAVVVGGQFDQRTCSGLPLVSRTSHRANALIASVLHDAASHFARSSFARPPQPQARGGIEKIAEYCYSLLLCVGAPGACRKGQNWPSPDLLLRRLRDRTEKMNPFLATTCAAPRRSLPRRRRGPPGLVAVPGSASPPPSPNLPPAAPAVPAPPAVPAAPAAPAPPPEPPKPVLTEQQAAVDAALVACRGGDLPKYATP